MPRGLLIGYTNPVDADHEAEFNRWYDEVHLPQVLSSREFVRGARFRATQSIGHRGLEQVPGTAAGAYLAV